MSSLPRTLLLASPDPGYAAFLRDLLELTLTRRSGTGASCWTSGWTARSTRISSAGRDLTLRWFWWVTHPSALHLAGPRSYLPAMHSGSSPPCSCRC